MHQQRALHTPQDETTFVSIDRRRVMEPPRLPKEARVLLKKGGTHKNKKGYDRKRAKQALRQANHE